MNVDNLEYMAFKITDLASTLKHYRRQCETEGVITDDLRRGVAYLEQFATTLNQSVIKEKELLEQKEKELLEQKEKEREEEENKS